MTDSEIVSCLSCLIDNPTSDIGTLTGEKFRSGTGKTGEGRSQQMTNRINL
jgi:hypothetical protein